MNDEKMYEMICSERFDGLDKKLDDLTGLLRGKNGGTGLVGDVQSLKKVNKWVFGAVVFIVCTGIAQVIHWIFTKI